jgi:protease-4
LRVDSPGGTVTASDYIYHHLKKLVKDKNIPLVVSMGSVAASGGYYVSMAAGDKEKVIYAEPTTWTGSIGVIIPHYNVAGLLEKWDIADDSVASGRYKQMGSPTRKLDAKQQEEEHALLKGLVDDSFVGFKEIVLASRATLRNNQALQDVVFTGQIFTAKQAQQNGLVDELGFLEDAIERAVQLTGLNRNDLRVVNYKKPETLASLLGGDASARASAMDLSQLLDMTAPRAYYLCTWLPGVAMSPQSKN